MRGARRARAGPSGTVEKRMSEFVPLPNGVRLRITRKFIDYLSDHRIFSRQNRQVMSWTEGEWLSFTKTAEMEPYRRCSTANS